MKLHEVIELPGPTAYRRASWPVGAFIHVLNSGGLVYVYDGSRFHYGPDLNDLRATDWEQTDGRT